MVTPPFLSRSVVAGSFMRPSQTATFIPTPTAGKLATAAVLTETVAVVAAEAGSVATAVITAAAVRVSAPARRAGRDLRPCGCPGMGPPMRGRADDVLPRGSLRRDAASDSHYAP